VRRPSRGAWLLLAFVAFGFGSSPLPPAPTPPVRRRRYSLAQLRELAAAMGFADPRVAAAVAWAESGGDACAQGDPPGPYLCDRPNGISTSFGLWQIHVPDHREYDPASLLDPAYNARAALAISKGGTDWHLWSTYVHGDYLAYV
jgi:hypothetical protein